MLFVCTANICRSPMAQGILTQRCVDQGVDARVKIASAGTHVGLRGHRPDPRAQAILATRGINISRLKAQPLVEADFSRFDFILAMDEEHLATLLKRRPEITHANMVLVMDYARLHDERQVPDPYYGNDAGFERVATLLEDAVDGFTEQILWPELREKGIL